MEFLSERLRPRGIGVPPISCPPLRFRGRSALWGPLAALGGAGQGRPTPGFRAGVMVELLAAGVPLERVEHLVGHARGSTIAAYVPEADPESVPVWQALVEEVARIPRLEESASAVARLGATIGR